MLLCFNCIELSVQCEGYMFVWITSSRRSRSVWRNWRSSSMLFQSERICGDCCMSGKIRTCHWRLSLNASSQNSSGATSLLKVSQSHSSLTWHRGKLFVLWFARSEGQCQDERIYTCRWLRCTPCWSSMEIGIGWLTIPLVLATCLISRTCPSFTWDTARRPVL